MNTPEATAAHPLGEAAGSTACKHTIGFLTDGYDLWRFVREGDALEGWEGRANHRRFTFCPDCGLPISQSNKEISQP